QIASAMAKSTESTETEEYLSDDDCGAFSLLPLSREDIDLHLNYCHGVVFYPECKNTKVSSLQKYDLKLGISSCIKCRRPVNQDDDIRYARSSSRMSPPSQHRNYPIGRRYKLF